MIGIDDGLIISTLFPIQPQQENPYSLDETLLEAELSSPTNISLTAKNLNEIYETLKQDGSEDALYGFTQYIQAMSAAYEEGSTSMSALMIKDMVENGDTDALNTLFENYGTLIKTDNKDLANLMMQTALSTYEELGYSSLKDYVTSVNKIFQQAGDEVPVSTLEDFITTWSQLKGIDTDSAQNINWLSDFSYTLWQQESLPDIQDVITQYLTLSPDNFL